MTVTDNNDVTDLVDGEGMESEAESLFSNCVSVVESQRVFTCFSAVASL